MIIKAIDYEKMLEHHAIHGACQELQAKLSVIAVWASRKREQYLVDVGGVLMWLDTEYFDVLDEAVPEYWQTVRFGPFHKIKNKKYNFSLPIVYFKGPRQFLEAPDFLFDTFEAPEKAYSFYMRTVKEES